MTLKTKIGKQRATSVKMFIKMDVYCSSKLHDNTSNNFYSQLRAQVADVMKSAKLLKPNITKKERQALVEQRKEKSIMILPAAKGKAKAIMDTDESEQKVTTMLSDDKTYEKLNIYPPPKCKRKLVSIIKKLKEEVKTTDE